ncbi:MAG TPA: hypothetical protein DDZ81_23835 [Acetobacteraceae bacterium]|nr:hypothetical protein [Acetobacteraceae bacterium]
MERTQVEQARGHLDVRGYTARIDIAVAIAALVVFISIEYIFQYQNVLGESDLYRVLIGIMDGAESGRGLNSPMHYDREFGFGYLAAIYHFVDPAILRDPDRLAPLMNEIGLWTLVPGLVCFWMAVRLVHGALAATVALIVFAFSPMIVDLGTSGHQVLPMFAFLSAAAVFLFLPVKGWVAVLAGVAATLALIAGFLSRGEIFLAFPWLVLSRIDTRDFRHFMISGFIRSVPPLASMVLFLMLQKSVVDVRMANSVGQYFFEFYTWATIIPGAVYMATGLGLATTAIGGLALAWLVWSVIRARKYPAELLGPLALVVIPMAFFLPNPMPTRHFLLTLAGVGIVLGIVVSRQREIGRATVYGLVTALVVGNQVLAEVARPALLRANRAHSPYLPLHDAYETTTHANIGWFWQHHAALIARRERWQAFGDMISTSCDPHTIIFSDENPQLFSRLYAAGPPVTADEYWYGRFAVKRAVRNGKDFLILEKMNGWPDDAVAAVLADPALRDYKLVEDPWTMSKYDRTPIPASREATFGCKP